MSAQISRETTVDIVIMEIREPGDLDEHGEQVVGVEVVGKENWSEAERMAWVQELQDTGRFSHITFILTRVAEPFPVQLVRDSDAGGRESFP